MSEPTIKPFWLWKKEKIAELGGWGSAGACKAKEWFWKEYGRYCNKMRAAK